MNAAVGMVALVLWVIFIKEFDNQTSDLGSVSKMQNRTQYMGCDEKWKCLVGLYRICLLHDRSYGSI